tara:strand:+ start:1966 stop:2310 length:345 start_codon:yes stop_codon:yes gene_type:complete
MKYDIFEINDNKFPVRFGFNSLRKFSLKTGATLNDLNKLSNGEMTFNDAFVLIYCGLEDGHRASKQKFRMSLDDVTDMFDGNMDKMQDIFSLLAKAMNNDSKGGKKSPATKGKS